MLFEAGSFGVGLFLPNFFNPTYCRCELNNYIFAPLKW